MYLLVSMGVPLKFVTAVTVNDIVDRAVSGADFSMAPEVTPTLAPSIDIQVPYNMERIYYFCSDGDHELGRCAIHRCSSALQYGEVLLFLF